MAVSPLVVFCPHEGVASAWHALEYGLDERPPWVRIAGWVGPVPEDFFLKRTDPRLPDRPTRVFSSLATKQDAGDLYDAVMGRAQNDLMELGQDMYMGVFKVLIILEANMEGPLLDASALEEFVTSVRNFCDSNEIPGALSFQAITILIQERKLVSKTVDVVGNINQILIRKRCPLHECPPKTMVMTTWDSDHIPTPLGDLEYMASGILHLGADQPDWRRHLLEYRGWVGETNTPVITGFRGFFWERIRAVDVARKLHFKEQFVLRWIKGEGWAAEGTFEDLPPVSTTFGENRKWGVTHLAWENELFINLKNLWGENKEVAASIKNLDDFRKKLEADVRKLVDVRLKEELKKARQSGKPIQEVVHRILNVVSILTKREINDRFKVLSKTIRDIQGSFDSDIEKYHRERIQDGTGLTVLRQHYGRVAKQLEDQFAEYALDKNTSFKTQDIMSHAMGAIVAMIERPHLRTLQVCGMMLFALLLFFFLGLFTVVDLSKTIVSPIMGLGAAFGLYYLLAIRFFGGKLGRLFSGVRAALLPIAAPALAFGVYYWLTNFTVGILVVNITVATCASIAITLAIVAYHWSEALANYEKKYHDLASVNRHMIAAMVNSRMVDSMRAVMHHARDNLNNHASELNKHIEEGQENLERFDAEPLKNPNEPPHMDILGVTNPATSLVTKNSWNEKIKEDTIRWAEEFWRDSDHKSEWKIKRPEKLDSGMWYANLTLISERSHRKFLLERCISHQLGDDDVGSILWKDMRRKYFQKVPGQAYIRREHIEGLEDHRHSQLWSYHPEGMGEMVKDHMQDNLSADAKDTVIDLLNPSLVCMLYMEHGYSWEGIQDGSEGSNG
tara:strand:+ start:5883 stop:8417 length:2535 start_codon:yes stop_codon:yes gene_type:complete